MIRRLVEPDLAAARALLLEDPAHNLYFLGNLTGYGLTHAECEFWGDFGSDGELRGLINRYFTGWVVYGRPDTDWTGLAQVMDAHPVHAERLQDNPGGVASFLPYLRRYRAASVSEQQLMRLDPDDFRPRPAPPGVTVRRATLADLEALVHFYAHAEQMRRPPARVVDPLRHRRIWLAEEGGAVQAAALTNAEAVGMAMVGGVYTRPEARGRGLSQAVMSGLCGELLAEGLTPVLYWEHPAAGAVYRKLGFRAIGVWRSVRLAPVTAGQPAPGPVDAPAEQPGPD